MTPWWSRPGRRDAAHVVATLVALEVLTFWAWFAGLTVPHGDFLAGYLTEAQAWWHRGTPVAPAGWLDYAWMGYPSEATLQNSSYYLPVGLAARLGPYTAWTAAVLSALHVAVGALGAYLVAARLRMGHAASLLVLVAWFFAPGAFANAQHVDISRGFAWTPWVLLVASPLWPWHRRWAVPVAALVLWQYLVGTYPGLLAVAAYCLLGWVAAWVLRPAAPRRWVAHLGLAGTAAVLAALAKFGPALALSAGSTAPDGQEAGLPLSLLPTAVLPYGSDLLPFDVSMRSFFVVAPVLVLLPWARRGPWTVPALAAGGIALALVLGGEVTEPVVRALPGMDLSRFRANDAKPVLLLAVVLLGASGLRSPADSTVTRRPLRAFASALPLALALVGLALQSPWRGGLLPAAGTAGAVVVLVASVAVVLVTARRPVSRPSPRPVASLLVLAALSGLVFAYGTTGPWQRIRTEVEIQTYGAPLARLAGPDCDLDATRRPARHPTPTVELTTSTRALAGAFTCEPAVGGYLNVKTYPAIPEQLVALTSGPDAAAVTRFYTAAGAVVPVAGDRLADTSRACLEDLDCAGLRARPVAYRPGRLEYTVEPVRAGPVALNESFYPGWSARVCVAAGCSAAPVSAGPARSVLVDLPAGVSTLTLEYRTPYRDLWLGLLVAGLALGAAGTALPSGLRSQQRSPSSGTVPSRK